MKQILEIFISTWYIWILILITSVFKLFLPKIKGYLGEQTVAFFLSRLDTTKYKVINNIMLQVDNKTTQIDHVIVSNYGIFVIETKNYKGWIVGNEHDEYWKQVIYKRKERLYNPIRQNYGHIQALKEALREYHDINYVSIVVFSTKATLKVKTSTNVIYTPNLLKIIKRYNTELLDDTTKEQIYSKLLSLNIDSKENRKIHIQDIHRKIIEENYRVALEKCPRCGGKLVTRNGKYGQFKGCSNYPKCRYTAS